MEAQKEYKRIVYIIATIAALGGLLFGLDQGLSVMLVILLISSMV
ncbi:putative membrane protein [Francisella tularensis subsp. tularensis]|nr:putative membrane protein [Francisella tularensis subsp. tularensis]KFJ65552.1 putative membrane protein [Francisella tularensis]